MTDNNIEQKSSSSSSFSDRSSPTIRSPPRGRDGSNFIEPPGCDKNCKRHHYRRSVFSCGVLSKHDTVSPPTSPPRDNRLVPAGATSMASKHKVFSKLHLDKHSASEEVSPEKSPPLVSPEKHKKRHALGKLLSSPLKKLGRKSPHGPLSPDYSSPSSSVLVIERQVPGSSKSSSDGSPSEGVVTKGQDASDFKAPKPSVSRELFQGGNAEPLVAHVEGPGASSWASKVHEEVGVNKLWAHEVGQIAESEGGGANRAQEAGQQEVGGLNRAQEAGQEEVGGSKPRVLSLEEYKMEEEGGILSRSFSETPFQETESKPQDVPITPVSVLIERWESHSAMQSPSSDGEASNVTRGRDGEVESAQKEDAVQTKAEASDETEADNQQLEKVTRGEGGYITGLVERVAAAVGSRQEVDMKEVDEMQPEINADKGIEETDPESSLAEKGEIGRDAYTEEPVSKASTEATETGKEVLLGEQTGSELKSSAAEEGIISTETERGLSSVVKAESSEKVETAKIAGAGEQKGGTAEEGNIEHRGPVSVASAEKVKEDSELAPAEQEESADEPRGDEQKNVNAESQVFSSEKQESAKNAEESKVAAEEEKPSILTEALELPDRILTFLHLKSPHNEQETKDKPPEAERPMSENEDGTSALETADREVSEDESAKEAQDTIGESVVRENESVEGQLSEPSIVLQHAGSDGQETGAVQSAPLMGDRVVETGLPVKGAGQEGAQQIGEARGALAVEEPAAKAAHVGHALPEVQHASIAGSEVEVPQEQEPLAYLEGQVVETEPSAHEPKVEQSRELRDLDDPQVKEQLSAYAQGHVAGSEDHPAAELQPESEQLTAAEPKANELQVEEPLGYTEGQVTSLEGNTGHVVTQEEGLEAEQSKGVEPEHKHLSREHLPAAESSEVPTLQEPHMESSVGHVAKPEAVAMQGGVKMAPSTADVFPSQPSDGPEPFVYGTGTPFDAFDEEPCETTRKVGVEGKPIPVENTSVGSEREPSTGLGSISEARTPEDAQMAAQPSVQTFHEMGDQLATIPERAALPEANRTAGIGLPDDRTAVPGTAGSERTAGVVPFANPTAGLDASEKQAVGLSPDDDWTEDVDELLDGPDAVHPTAEMKRSEEAGAVSEFESQAREERNAPQKLDLSEFKALQETGKVDSVMDGSGVSSETHQTDGLQSFQGNQQTEIGGQEKPHVPEKLDLSEFKALEEAEGVGSILNVPEADGVTVSNGELRQADGLQTSQINGAHFSEEEGSARVHDDVAGALAERKEKALENLGGSLQEFESGGGLGVGRANSGVLSTEGQLRKAPSDESSSEVTSLPLILNKGDEVSAVTSAPVENGDVRDGDVRSSEADVTSGFGREGLPESGKREEEITPVDEKENASSVLDSAPIGALTSGVHRGPPPHPAVQLAAVSGILAKAAYQTGVGLTYITLHQCGMLFRSAVSQVFDTATGVVVSFL